MPSSLDRTNLYSIVEQIKNGHYETSKYRGSIVVTYSPHVVIFANFLPDVSKFTSDRWKLYMVGKNSKELLTIGQTQYNACMKDQKIYDRTLKNSSDSFFSKPFSLSEETLCLFQGCEVSPLEEDSNGGKTACR